MRNKIIMLSIILVTSLILLNIFDVRYQFFKEIQSISNMSTNDIEKKYGIEVSNLYKLSDSDGYALPTISYFKLNKNAYIMNFTSILYENSEDTFGNVIDSISVDVHIPIKRNTIFLFEILDFSSSYY